MSCSSSYLVGTRAWRPEGVDPEAVKMFYGGVRYQLLKALVEYEEFSVDKAAEVFSQSIDVSEISRYTKTKIVKILKELVVAQMLDITNVSHKLAYRRYRISSKGIQHVKEKEKRFEELKVHAIEFFDSSELVGDFKVIVNNYDSGEGIRARYGLKGILKGFSIVLYFQEFTDHKGRTATQWYTEHYTRNILDTSKFFGTLRSVNSKVPRTDWNAEEVEMFMIALRRYGKFPHPERYKSVNDINKEILKSYCVFRHGANQNIDLQDYEVPLLISEFPLIQTLAKDLFGQNEIKAEA